MMSLNDWGITALGVVQAIVPILAILLLFQILFLKLPKNYVTGLLKGTGISALGLLIFLQGIQSGFLPYGQLVGQALGGFKYKWILVPFGFLIGFFTTWGEPAVRILCNQVEEASAGSIRKVVVLIAICIGVSFSVALAMARIAYSIPLLHILIPGYIMVMIMLWFTPEEFLSIAFDAGGVATGPITNTFLLGIGLGLASVSINQSTITSGLGLIALVALAPIISVMILGIIIRIKTNYRGGKSNG